MGLKNFLNPIQIIVDINLAFILLKVKFRILKIIFNYIPISSIKSVV